MDLGFFCVCFAATQLACQLHQRERDNVVYWKTKRKINDDLQCTHTTTKSPSPGGFPITHVPSSRTVSVRTPLEEFVPGASRGVLLLTVLDEGT